MLHSVIYSFNSVIHSIHFRSILFSVYCQLVDISFLFNSSSHSLLSHDTPLALLAGAAKKRNNRTGER